MAMAIATALAKVSIPIAESLRTRRASLAPIPLDHPNYDISRGEPIGFGGSGRGGGSRWEKFPYCGDSDIGWTPGLSQRWLLNGPGRAKAQPGLQQGEAPLTSS